MLIEASSLVNALSHLRVVAWNAGDKLPSGVSQTVEADVGHLTLEGR